MKPITPLILALFLPIPAAGDPAIGNPIVYHSPDGQGAPAPGPAASIDAEDDQALHLFIDYENVPDVGPSSLAGTMCVDEDGDETCAFDVLLEMVTDTATFDSFTPAAAGIVGRIDPDTRTSFRVNGIEVDGMAIPGEIGTLTLDALGANQLQISVVGVHRVGAAGQLDAIQPRVIVNLPEPGRDVLLASGLLALAALHRLRRHRGRAVA